MATITPRPASAPAPKYEWNGVSAPTRQEVELQRPAMLRAVDAALTGVEGDYWIGDEVYAADVIRITCHVGEAVHEVALRWDPTQRSFTRA